ncbi:MAG: methylated-DNA--[protein]-cysteine S-methyltransferase [Candidatus Amulumruptor caecigallinarius]|nr:methylated-DNA--[protein]-cysteine S-methyltransferase [Candidatus Amulumruptor caecigallinarius]MCM1397579.1 methylated-DNA--[protein]-cysteine S-methyltransferase [Candidatus Amulumruptor caecigallinarius]MCM1453955.1 methylated-DNA--[protein]-cysteine S-methyltransferase [bacterium]
MDVITPILYHSPCGRLALASCHGSLCMCDWAESPHHQQVLRRLSRELGSELDLQPSEVTTRAMHQLDEYFSGLRREFTIPLLPTGTPFMQRVWSALPAIAYGAAIAYASLAQSLGIPDAVRSVARAIGANPLSIFIPCHRVIGSNGSLTGYAGGLSAKHYLLRLERSSSSHSDKLG